MDNGNYTQGREIMLTFLFTPPIFVCWVPFALMGLVLVSEKIDDWRDK